MSSREPTDRPVETGDTPAGAAAAASRPGRGQTPLDAENAAILVVDDDRHMRLSVSELLSAGGHTVLMAATGADALALLDRHSIDLVLLDLLLPDMHGLEVMRVLQERHPGMDVVVVSGDTTFESATGALRSGVRDFLRKPYAPSELLRLVDHTLDRRRLQRDLQAINEQLSLSEQRYRFIVNNSPDIIYMLDAAGCFTFVNQRIEPLLGFTPEEVLGQHYTAIIHEDDLDKARLAFNERRTGARAASNLELRLRCKEPRTDYRHFETRSVVIEFSAMGIYESLGQPTSTSFRGTYGVARDITERKRAEEIITFQLYHDLLTRLPNRARFRDRLQLALAQARRHRTRLAIMFLDMDRFKVVNDSLGHLAGDQLLQMVAARLQSCVRDSDTLARVGGDEFNLLVPDISSADDAGLVAEKILSAFRTPLMVEGHEVFVGFSIGIAIYPDDGDSIDVLVRHADMAMYHVKRHGKNGYQLYNADMRNLFQAQLSLDSAVRRALDEQQFELYFQPQVELASGRVTGMESLIRWHHPSRGLVMPGDFIPIAEETGLIVDIGAWVLEAACLRLREWRDKGRDDLTMAVNISATQLAAPDFEQRVLACLAQHGVSPCRLELEITENLLMLDMDQAVSTLRALSRHGVRVAVDDFGVGYSSLGYLQKLPLHTLKIDRSFLQEVRGPHDRSSIISAIHALSRELGLDMVAEGVENEAQLEFLRALGCPKAQGYLLGHPSPTEPASLRI